MESPTKDSVRMCVCVCLATHVTHVSALQDVSTCSIRVIT